MIGFRKRGLPPPFQTIPLSAIAALALKIYFIDSLSSGRMTGAVLTFTKLKIDFHFMKDYN